MSEYPHNDQARLTFVGQFSDKNIEQEFQQTHLDATCRRVRFICAISAIAYMVAGYADSMQLSGLPLATMLTARATVTLTGLVPMFHSFRKNLSLRALGWTTGIYMTAIMCGEIIELLIESPYSGYEGVPITLFIVLAYYLYIPPQIWQSIIAGGLGSLAYLLALFFFTGAPPGYMLDTTLTFVVVNGFGIYFAIRFGSTQRREYLALTNLKHQAETDSLTGIHNRRQIIKLGARELHAAKRYEYPCSLLMLDVDHFKTINDKYGHAAGDLVLRELTGRCQNSLRAVDHFGRFGGEEFVIIMPHCSSKQAAAAADRIREIVANRPFHLASTETKITISIGVTEISKETLSLDNLLHDADTALYQAKQNGRNRVCLCGWSAPDTLPESLDDAT